MNREKDFHVKSKGVIINTNAKDYNRARRRNRIMKETSAALGENGELKKVVNEVVKITNSPSRAEERVSTLEAELETTKRLNQEMTQKLNESVATNDEIKQQLINSQQINDEIKDRLDDALEVKNDFERLKKLVEQNIGS